MSVIEFAKKGFELFKFIFDGIIGNILDVYSFLVTFFGIASVIGIILIATTRNLTKALQYFAKQHIGEVKKENGYDVTDNITISTDILPSILKNSGDEPICLTELNGIANLLNDPAKVKFIVGEGGCGKTTLLLHLTEWLCNRSIKLYRAKITSSSSNYVTQFFTSRDLEEAVPCDSQSSLLLTLISSNIQELKKNEKIRNRLMKIFADRLTWKKFEEARSKWKKLHKGAYNFRLLLLIDGYNELSSSVQNRLKKELEHINGLTGDCVNVIITSRYNPSILSTATYKVNELSEEQIRKCLNVDENPAPRVDYKLLKSPIRLSMYRKTYSLLDDLRNKKLPVNDQDISASNIYWNYMCSHLHKTIEGNRGEEKDIEILTHKTIILFYVLPYMAMILEAKNTMRFTVEDFRNAYMEFCKNKDLFRLRTNWTGLSEFISEDHWDTLKPEGVAKMLRSFLVQEIALIIETDDGKTQPFMFRHQLYRNFYAAVYRVQRDVCTLQENNLITLSEGIPMYTYSACEKLPDISLVVRKFYYELVGYYFMKKLAKDDRDALLRNSVRLNSVYSDLYYYGDASLVGFMQDYQQALKYAEKAIEIAESRLINVENVSEQALRTDMTLLGWIRWCAIHIIQNFKSAICVDSDNPDDTYAGYVIKSYEYAKAITRATGYGEFVGYDKLAQMLIRSRDAENRYLPYDILINELSDAPGESLSEKMTYRILEYLKKGEENEYHFSFSKHALYFGEEAAKKYSIDDEKFKECIQTAYEYYKKAYEHKDTDIYALARVIFYAICYNDILNIKDDEICKLIESAEPVINDMLQLSSPAEIYGYINFCENVAFYYLYKLILPVENVLSSEGFVSSIEKATSENCSITVKPVKDNPASYFSTLFSAAKEIIIYKMGRESQTTKNKNLENQVRSLDLSIVCFNKTYENVFNNDEIKTEYIIKAFIAYLFIVFVTKGIEEKTLQGILVAIMTSPTGEKLLKSPNKFFKEIRYSVMLQFLLVKGKLGGEADACCKSESAL